MEVGLLSVLIMVAITAGFVFVTLFVGKFVRPNRTSKEKETPYECGEIPSVDAWFNYNPRFYLVALIFVVFDVEMAFMFPVLTVFDAWVKNNRGLLALIEVGIFVLILLGALVYLWARGELRWIKELAR